MRQDMSRLNSIRSFETCGQRSLLSRGAVRDLECLPTHQSMRSAVPHYTNPRTMKLSPARRWLRQQANRPWNAVYAELRERFNPHNLANATILESLLSCVEMDVYFEGAQPRVAVTFGSYAVSNLYVHPTTGLLLDAKLEVGAAKERQMARQARAAAKAAKRIQVSENCQLHLVDGLWFFVELAPITPPLTRDFKAVISATGEVLVEASTEVDYSTMCRDVLSGRSYEKVPKNERVKRDLFEAYGDSTVYAKRKWQASRRDVARAKRDQVTKRVH